MFRTEGAAYLRNIRSKQRHLDECTTSGTRKQNRLPPPPPPATQCWFFDPLRFPGNAPKSMARSYLLIRTPRVAWLSSGPALPQTSRPRNGWSALTTSSPTTSSVIAMALQLRGRPLRTTARGFKKLIAPSVRYSCTESTESEYLPPQAAVRNRTRMTVRSLIRAIVPAGSSAKVPTLSERACASETRWYKYTHLALILSPLIYQQSLTPMRLVPEENPSPPTDHTPAAGPATQVSDLHAQPGYFWDNCGYFRTFRVHTPRTSSLAPGFGVLTTRGNEGTLNPLSNSCLCYAQGIKQHGIRPITCLTVVSQE